jgi:PAS domain S-box-containing protein
VLFVSTSANTASDELSLLRQRNQELEQLIETQASELQQLRNRCDLFDAMLDAIPDMVLCKGPGSHIVYANKAFRDYYGMSNEELADLIDAPFNEPDYTQQYVKDDAYVFATGEVLDIPREPVTRYDGHLSWFRTRKSAIRNANGEITHTVGISHDLTIQDQADMVIQAQNERFQRIVASVPGMVYQFVLFPDRTISYPFVSDGCRELYGIEPEEAQRDGSQLLNGQSEALALSIQESARQLTPWKWEGQIVTRQGVTKWVQGIARPSRRDDGRVVWDGIVIDISDRKQAELAQAELQQEVIAAQQRALAELSTPLIPVNDEVVVMPLVGSIDSQRAQEILETLLVGIEQQQARLVIIDITGVQIVDTHVANALVRAAQAVGLMGARVMITGIRPEVAQTMVNVGIDLSAITTRATLQSGIAEALRRLK